MSTLCSELPFISPPPCVQYGHSTYVIGLYTACYIVVCSIYVTLSPWQHKVQTARIINTPTSKVGKPVWWRRRAVTSTSIIQMSLGVGVQTFFFLVVGSENRVQNTEFYLSKTTRALGFSPFTDLSLLPAIVGLQIGASNSLNGNFQTRLMCAFNLVGPEVGGHECFSECSRMMNTHS